MQSPETGRPPEIGELLTALVDPATYPHPVRGLHVIQTHTSCVALTGDLVYKVKKPVDFGFLDYGTPEKRRAMCEQEVRLNRRLTPEVYLDVVPLARVDGRLRVADTAPAVEWAVRMRQLPERDLLPERLRAETVKPRQIRELAVLLAGFHGRSPAHEADRFGVPEQIAENIRENFEFMDRQGGDVVPAAHLKAIADFSERFITERRALFERRIAEGRVRDGHGDLRAQNICLTPGIQGGIQVLDCIEFNERFRYGDVACDLAYLAMDLDLVGRRDLREVLVDAYVEAAGDPGLREVLSFYLCYRACVRGKIALLAAAETEIPAPERAAHRELAMAAFDLARSYAGARDRPTLWVMVGLSGSGKSVLARELARRIPAVCFRSDRVRKELAGVPGETRLGDAHYSADAVSAVYSELRRRARKLISEGVDVILDATFLAYDERQKTRELARDLKIDHRVVECECPDSEIRRRLAAREAAGNDPSDAGIAVYEAQRLRRDPLRPEEGAVTIRTDRPAAEAAREALEGFWRSD
jgi:aminoglycoside phosphotransferase family enzyme/predicted kinase